jgi:hypothetical protein
MKLPQIALAFMLTISFASFAQASCSEGQTTTVYNPITIQTDYGVQRLPVGTLVTINNLQPDGPTAYFHVDVSGNMPARAQPNFGSNGAIVSCGITPPQSFSGTLINLSTAVYPFSCNIR